MQVRFNLVDEFGRKTSRTYDTSSVTIADALVDVAAMAAVLDPVTQGGLTEVVISTKDTGDAFAATSPSNIDENASISVLGADGYNYDVDLPMPVAALRLAGGAIDTSALIFTNWIGQFQGINKWRINLRNPTQVSSVNGGQLDK